MNGTCHGDTIPARLLLERAITICIDPQVDMARHLRRRCARPALAMASTGEARWKTEDWEGFESVLITVYGVSITSEPNEDGQCETSWDELTLDDMFYSYFDEWSMSSEFDEITEILGYSDGSWRLYTSGECGFLFARKTP